METIADEKIMSSMHYQSSFFKVCAAVAWTFLFLNAQAFSQSDSTQTDEEDYSMYENMDFADEGQKRFCSAKIFGLSPAKLISVGYDFQGAYDISAGAFSTETAQTAAVSSTHGPRIFANIPVISKNNIIVQLGANYWKMNYEFENPSTLTHPLHRTLSENGLTTAGLNTTIFKPINEEQFITIQASADANGDWAFNDLQPLKYNRYSVAALWGKRSSDLKQWAIGLSRTYRAGEQNIVPVVLFNWTSVNRKWGTELLLPARGHMRYSFNTRNMLFLGYELEGNSYRIGNQQVAFSGFNNLEIRRSELRFRAVYERQLVGFIWLSAQAGYRINYLYNVDSAPNGNDFFRGFFGDQPYVMENDLTNPLYFNLSINLVSP